MLADNPGISQPVAACGVHVSIVGTGMGWTIAEADADIALHGRKLRGCFETSGNEEPPRQPQALQRI